MANDPIAITVVIPVFNEAALLADVVDGLIRELRELSPSFEVIISENGSDDGTDAIADQLASQWTEVRALHDPRANYGLALRRGLLAARGEVLANFSADLIQVDFLRGALALLTDFDIVLGSKYLRPNEDRRPRLRQLIGQGYQMLIRVFFGLPVRDTLCIKAYRRDRVWALIEKCRNGGALFDAELILRAHLHGLRLCEVPLSWEEIRPSRMGVVRLAMRSLAGLIRLRLDLLLGRL